MGWWRNERCDMDCRACDDDESAAAPVQPVCSAPHDGDVLAISIGGTVSMMSLSDESSFAYLSDGTLKAP